MARDSVKLFRNSRFSLSALPFLPGAPPQTSLSNFLLEYSNFRRRRAQTPGSLDHENRSKRFGSFAIPNRENKSRCRLATALTMKVFVALCLVACTLCNWIKALRNDCRGSLSPVSACARFTVHNIIMRNAWARQYTKSFPLYELCVHSNRLPPTSFFS